MKQWKPIMIENSRIPKLLSYLSPISIGAITLGFLVLSRDKMSEQTRRHETIHFQQFLETGFIFFILIYFWDWFVNLLRYGNGQIAYYQIRAEIEAYDNDSDEGYLATRKRWQWLRGGKDADLSV